MVIVEFKRMTNMRRLSVKKFLTRKPVMRKLIFVVFSFMCCECSILWCFILCCCNFVGIGSFCYESGIVAFAEVLSDGVDDQRPVFEDGEFSYMTRDKRATSNIRWGNVGYTICFEQSYGAPVSVDHIMIMFEAHDERQASKFIDTSRPDYNYTYYRIKEDLIRREFDKKYGQGYYDAHAVDGGRIYFNNIFMTYWGVDSGGNPIKYKGPFVNKKDIENVTGIVWPPEVIENFAQHFDISVAYSAPIFPAEVVYYIEGTNTVISASKLGESKWGKPNAEVEHRMASSKLYEGKEYRLIESYYTQIRDSVKKYNRIKLNSDGSNLQLVRDQKGIICFGGTVFVGIMRKVPEKEVIDEGEFMEPISRAVIGADSRGDELFHVLEGIPTTEKLYVNVFSDSYLVGYLFRKVSGHLDYSVEAVRTYYLEWDGKKESESVSQIVNIRRHYEYWMIERLDVFAVGNAELVNYALPDGRILLDTVGYSPPTVLFKHSEEVVKHIRDPVLPTKLRLPPMTIRSEGGKPEVPYEYFSPYVEDAVGGIVVMNDSLVFNGEIIMSDIPAESVSPHPKAIPYSKQGIHLDVLYESGLVIDAGKHNGVHSSAASINYVRIAGINSSFGDILSYGIEGVNPVRIHTPVICDAKIEDISRFNQMLFPDTSRNSLVLDRSFHIQVPAAGTHLNIKGYGYRDYSRYTEVRQVRFPFDVYSGKKYLRRGVWHNIDSDITAYYLPIWVDEGTYTIDFRSISINCFPNGGLSQTEALRNEDLENYVAVDSILVEVSGRLYGLSLYDISDYPLWEAVFRNKGSLQPSGLRYVLGRRDQNGDEADVDSMFTMPNVRGSHPFFKNEGPVKAGYSVRFTIDSIGSMSGELDYVRILPTFYFCRYDGTRREEVDLYYSETFLGEKYELVKMGGELDKRNIKALRLGEPYLSVPDNELESTAGAKGVSILFLQSISSRLFTYMNIMIPSSLQTVIGQEYHKSIGLDLPTDVNEKRIEEGKQRWYCQYYLPSIIHAVPKNFDVYGYAEENGIDYFENFWLKDGYIIINFNIETIKNGQRCLSYINTENFALGYCNMWSTEGYLYEKTDAAGNGFEFIDGDYLLYYADSSKYSVLNDYISGGTH